MNPYSSEDEPIYVRWVRRHYGALMYVLWFIATETSDRGADIAARALALLAPLPNAVSVYNVSQQSLGYAPVQALAFAFAIELALFAVIEVALHMWDGYLANPQRYAIPLAASIIATVGVLAIVVSVVYQLEVKTGGHWILASLPFISLCAFVALGLKRWHERPAAQRTTKNAQRTAQKPAQVVQPISAQPAQAKKVRQAHQLKSAGLNNTQIATKMRVHRNTVGNLLKQPLPVVHTPSANGHTKEAAR